MQQAALARSGQRAPPPIDPREVLLVSDAAVQTGHPVLQRGQRAVGRYRGIGLVGCGGWRAAQGSSGGFAGSRISELFRLLRLGLFELPPEIIVAAGKCGGSCVGDRKSTRLNS